MVRDVISAKDFTRTWVESIFESAERIRWELSERSVLNYARDRILMTVFLEPSTRTRLSFQFAMTRLGGTVIDFGLEVASSIAKGESFEDTITMVDGYSPDVIVIRSREPGSAKKAAEIAAAPVINAGDGTNEHPTQALLDVYTMWKVFGRVDGLKVGIMGDLKYGRTPSSLAYLLSKFKDVKLYFIAPPQLQIREEVLEAIGGIKWTKLSRLEELDEELDVLYVTRLQRERLPSQEEYERLRGSYVVTLDLLKKLRRIPIIMHPLPRVDELSTEVDQLPQAKYFEQARNGVYIRAALIKDVLGL